MPAMQPHAVLRWVLSSATSLLIPWKSWETEAGSPGWRSGFHSIPGIALQSSLGTAGNILGDSQGFLSAFALQDVRRCLSALEELGTLQVTSQILQKNTDVVATLKKVWYGQGI